MATHTVRNLTHNIIYWCVFPEGKKQIWESYTTELEAMQRKTFIDYLQKTKANEKLVEAANEYKKKRDAEKAALNAKNQALVTEISSSEILGSSGEDNTKKTYGEFAKKWLPFHARKNRFSPNSYDSYLGNLNNHILPYFGEKIMSSITAEDIDNFMDFLSTKPCKGSKSYRKKPSEIPTLASSSVKKCYTVFTAGFQTAKNWRYITEIPETTAPIEKFVKRKFWHSKQVLTALQNISEDKLLHLTIHLAFICSLRAGETVGIRIDTIDYEEKFFWINQEVQRVSDNALSELPKNEIIRVFPKDIPRSKSSLILKPPKTEESTRKLYLTEPLFQEIRERIEEVKENKAFFGNEYQDYGLLICKPDGRPFDPKDLNNWFKPWQISAGIENQNQIDFQGLRKSGQMHKIRLMKNFRHYEEVIASDAGHSPKVMNKHYDEVLDSDKRNLIRLIENDFYPQYANRDTEADKGFDLGATIQAIQGNPEIAKQIMQLLISNAVNVSQ